MRRPSNELLRKNHSVPTGVSALASSDFSYMRYEYMRTARSHDRLPGGNEEHAMFKRTSSLADLAYIALPGLTSRVSRDSATVSLVHLSDAFSDMPEHESPTYVEGGMSSSLFMTVGAALLSTLLYGYNNANLNTPAAAMRSSLGIPPTVLTPEGVSVSLPSNDMLWSFVVSIFSLGALLGCSSSPTHALLLSR